MRILAVLMLALLAGCGPKMISYNSVTPATSEATYDCVLGKVNGLGYTVSTATREGRLVTAEKEFHVSATQVFTRQTYYDRLTVSIFDADSTTRKIRITITGTIDNAHFLTGTTSRAHAPSAQGQLDAGAILTACGGGLVTKEPGGAR
jgi:VCBS repeat-containing protein